MVHTVCAWYVAYAYTYMVHTVCVWCIPYMYSMKYAYGTHVHQYTLIVQSTVSSDCFINFINVAEFQ